MSRLVTREPRGTCSVLEITPDDMRRASKDDLVSMLFLIYLVREFETAVLNLNDQGLVYGPVHTSIGQEAVAAGTAVALRKTDLVGSTHRAHGHFISKALMYYAPEGYQPLRDGLTPGMQQAVNRTLAEIMGLRDGWCQGRGGSMHLYDGESGNIGSNAIVGGGIPLVTGAAWGEKLLKKDTVAVSLFGDGAINQGCFHEAANIAALWGVPVVYFVENNLYAVGTRTAESCSVGDLAVRSLAYRIDSLILDGMDPLAVYLGLTMALEKTRREKAPFFIEGRTYRHFHHAGRLPGSAYGYRDKEEEKKWLERDPLRSFPSALKDTKVIREGDDESLREKAKMCVEQAVEFCTETSGGKRVIPPRKWPPTEDLRPEERKGREKSGGGSFVEMEDFERFKTVTYVEAIAAVTLRRMQKDDRVIVMGEEVGNLGGGAYQACKGIKEAFPERLINTPISETGFVGVAGGAASAGLKPVVEIMFPDFALMASDQLFNQIGKLSFMYGDRVHFPVVLRTRIGIGFGYGGQHSMNPAGLFALHSGWRILAPSTAFDYIGLFNTAMRFQDPVLIIEHGKLYGDSFKIPVDNMDYLIPYGRARVVKEGDRLTVLTYLTGLKESLLAAEGLGEAARGVEIIDLRTLDYAGVDYGTIGRSLRKTGCVLIVEQAPRSMGISARLSDEIQERFYDDLDAPVGRVVAPDVPAPVSKVLESAMWPSCSEIREKMELGCRHHF